MDMAEGRDDGKKEWGEPKWNKLDNVSIRRSIIWFEDTSTVHI